MSAYAHGHHPTVLAAHGVRTAADSAAYLLPHLRSGLVVLDVGCGPGSITLDLAALVGPTGRVVGCETSATALESARAEAARRGDAATEFVLADAGALPYDDATFDVTHAHQVLQHLADPVAALREMARVTRPGGLVAARDVDYASFVWYPDDAALTDWLAVYRSIGRALGVTPEAGRHLRAWARAAGLTDVRVGASTWSYGTPEETAWWGGMWAERVHASSYADHAARLGLATPEQIAAMSAAWRRWADHPDAWLAMTHGELLARRA